MYSLYFYIVSFEISLLLLNGKVQWETSVKWSYLHLQGLVILGLLYTLLVVRDNAGKTASGRALSLQACI